MLAFLKNDCGATAIEYGLIAALMATGLLIAMACYTTQINSLTHSNKKSDPKVAHRIPNSKIELCRKLVMFSGHKAFGRFNSHGSIAAISICPYSFGKFFV
jgi:Flp pilus assembly pilin Flp